MDRLVTQMLALARLESRSSADAPVLWTHAVHWPTLVQQVINDCLPLADRRHIEMACEWPPEPDAALPLFGDSPLLTVMLRNLLDNAVRYAPEGSLVMLRFSTNQLTVDNDGPALDQATLARLGERFYRPDGQMESGSGLGVSIIRRIADLHGLQVQFSPGAGGLGMQAQVSAVQPTA